LAVLSSGDAALVRDFKSDPSDRRKRQALNTLYWEMLFRLLRERANGGKAESLNLGNKSDFVDSGLIDDTIIEGGESEVNIVVKENGADNNSLVFPFGIWIEREYQRILNFDKRDALSSDISDLNHQLLVKDREIAAKQEER